MTAGTVISTGGRYEGTMIWRRRMQRAPGIRMTRRTVTASRKVLEIGAIRRYQRSVAIMTGGTSVMRIICCAYQWCCCMTVEAASRADYCY